MVFVWYCKYMILTEIVFLRKKDKKHQKKNLVVNLLELIQVIQKMVMIQKFEVGNIEAFTDEFKNKKRKNLKTK